MRVDDAAVCPSEHVRRLHSAARALAASFVRLQRPRPERQFTGCYRKDEQASTPMDDAMDAMHVPRLLRTAAGLARDLKIRHDEKVFETCIRAGPLRVSEAYPLNAPELTLRHEWDDPHGAVATETFHLSGEDEHNVLTVVTHIMFRDKRSVNLRTVYRRLG